MKTLGYIHRLDEDQAQQARIVLEYWLWATPIPDGETIDSNAHRAMVALHERFPDIWPKSHWYHEPIRYIASKHDYSNYPMGFEYLEADTYCSTLLWDYARRQFVVSSWGDYVEAYPKRFGE